MSHEARYYRQRVKLEEKARLTAILGNKALALMESREERQRTAYYTAMQLREQRGLHPERRY